MVVPFVECYREKKPKRIVGNGRVVTMPSNEDVLTVIGSGNNIKVGTNQGLIQIIGDGCRISVSGGDGRIEYVGDGGYLETGSVNLSNVTYTGDGGRIVSAKKSQSDVHVKPAKKTHISWNSLSHAQFGNVVKVSSFNIKCATPKITVRKF